MIKINPLIEFQPSREALAVLILQSKVPDLSESNSFHNLQKDKRNDVTNCSLFRVYMSCCIFLLLSKFHVKYILGQRDVYQMYWAEWQTPAQHPL